MLVSEVCEEDTDEAVTRSILLPTGFFTYSYRPVTSFPSAISQSYASTYNHVPVVLDANGAPWPPAVIYLLDILENAAIKADGIANARSIATDLAAYLKFLTTYSIDFRDFPIDKTNRPTYRYRAELTALVAQGELSQKVAKRRMGAVIHFYRKLIKESYLTPQYEPWEERSIQINYNDSFGSARTKTIITNNLSIKAPEQVDPYSGHIIDEKRLRPLTINEQVELLNLLLKSKNTEMKLIHFVFLFTGARTQTALTLKRNHFLKEQPSGANEVRIPVGLGTGADVKNNKKQTLHMPIWLYNKLRIYAHSQRYNKRFSLLKSGADNPPLFITNRGTPYYITKAEVAIASEANNSRQTQDGQPVRQFIHDHILPTLKSLFGENYTYTPHDLRATFGMNLTDQQMELVKKDLITLKQAHSYVKTRMGHNNSQTTDGYLNYRTNSELFNNLQHQYDTRLLKLIDELCNG